MQLTKIWPKILIAVVLHTGETNIVEHWQAHFDGILNTNVCDQPLKNSILGTLDDCLLYSCAEALKCAHDQLSVLLSLCFALFLSHGYLPPKLIETTIVPIIKNKCGNISSSNNYRLIA